MQNFNTNENSIISINDQDQLYQVEYQEIVQSKKKIDNNCQAFAFSADETQIIVASYDVIIIFEFKDGQILNEIQRLNNHYQQIYCLYALKKSNQFVSGGEENFIIIWKQQENKLWIADYVLFTHQKQIYCILMNDEEDLLITGGSDKTIKFWQKQKESWNCESTVHSNQIIYNFSLNEKQNKLAVCGEYSSIQIIGKKPDQKWALIQTINVLQSGKRICFTFGNQFIFQPNTKDYIEVYNLEKGKKRFEKIKQVKVQSCSDCQFCFPCQFIKQQKILFVKHGSYVNVFKVLEKNYEYALISTIQFKHQYNQYGCASKNGQYFVSWDQASEEIQLRKLKPVEKL